MTSPADTAVVSLDPADLEVIVAEVLSSLELDFTRSYDAPPVEVATTGSITISGTWEGSVLLELSLGMDRLLAATMFQLEPEVLVEDEISDAVGELTNMIGGSVKSLLPEPSRLSLPTVVTGRNLSLRMPGSVMVDELVGQCQGLPLRISVWALLPG